METFIYFTATKDLKMKDQKDSKKFLKAIGSKFYALRTEQHKELDTVAKAVKISPELLKRIEEGKYDMHLDLLFELCEYYKITPYDFFKRTINCSGNELFTSGFFPREIGERSNEDKT